MAEDEIAKHSRKIYKTWFNKDLGIWHKISEFLIEITIIVFAVTISIWFHNLSEHKHQQEEVKQFLTGLKADLSQDIKEMENDMESYQKQGAIFTYIGRLKKNQWPSKDTLNANINWLYNTTALNPNDGRFQGFKSSGKIGTIENDSLQNDIMDLYEENIPALLHSTDSYIRIKTLFFDLLNKNSKRLTDSTDDMINVIKTDEAFNLCRSLGSPVQVIERYDQCIQLMERIIARIDNDSD
jgi:molybdopterin synthase catalytic subunit